MAKYDSSKFFWMKLYTRFFDKHEIKILWKTDRDYVLLYIRLLLESVPYHGFLKYNNDIPYTAQDIALLFDFPIETVEKGIKELVSRQLLVISKDNTMFLPAAPAMTCYDSGAALRMKDKRHNTNTLETQLESASGIIGEQLGSNVPDLFPICSLKNKDKNSGGGKGRPPISDDSQPKYPTSFDQVEAFLDSKEFVIANYDGIRAKFMSLCENGWTDDNGQVIADWRKFFSAIADRQVIAEAKRLKGKANK